MRVLVTGAASGIGKGIAEKFLAKGSKVILLDKDEETLTNTIEELKSLNPSVQSVLCDLRNEVKIQAAADGAWSYWDGIDVLVNNAGVAVRESFIDIPLSNWDHILDVNLRGTFLLSQILAKKMIDSKISGSIINMSSKNGLSGSSKLTHYNSSKAGINLLTQSMAVELAAMNIRVNAVAPGFIETPLDRNLKQKEKNLNLTDKTPMKRLGTIHEVANGVYFLASKEASYITGTTLVIDGGHLANGSEF
nr:SDR family oxidoreductase [Virgibacillus ihumii]